MITSETVMQGIGPRNNAVFVPDIFADVEPVEFQSVVATECSDWVKDGLDVVGLGRPTNKSMTEWYQLYVRAGYRKATPDDFRQREDGTPGCSLMFDESEQGYIDGDIILMVIDKRIRLGHQKADFIRANAPTWSKEQREQLAISGILGAKVAARIATLDNPNIRTDGPRTTKRAYSPRSKN